MRDATKSEIGSEIRGQGLCWILLVAALLSFSPVPVKAADPDASIPVKAADPDSADAQELVARARISFQSLLKDPNMTWFRDHLKDARGILIVPQLLKAAFFVGGSGGSGVLLARDEKTGEWSEPAFYTLGSGSFGLQFGAEASEVVLLVMTQRGVEAMLTSTLKLGGDASVAIGPVGGGVQGATANLSADILSFALSKGLFAGLSLEGAVVAARDDWNNAYYGKAVRPLDILMNRSVSNSHSAELRAAIAKATSGR